MTIYPLRAVYLSGKRNDGMGVDVPVQVMVSVPKKCLAHAVDRNRVKRQVREAYRKNKGLLSDLEEDEYLIMAFIWLDRKLHATDEIEKRLRLLLHRINEKR